jgi:hypothetical protein
MPEPIEVWAIGSTRPAVVFIAKDVDADARADLGARARVAATRRGNSRRMVPDRPRSAASAVSSFTMPAPGDLPKSVSASEMPEPDSGEAFESARPSPTRRVRRSKRNLITPAAGQFGLEVVHLVGLEHQARAVAELAQAAFARQLLDLFLVQAQRALVSSRV